MIAFLKGQLAYHTPQGVVIDVQGVGYEVRLSERHLASLNLQAGQNLHLTTHLLSREDALELYGFRSPPEKELFLQLTRVSGIGPRSALAIFSVLDTEQIVSAIVSNQPKILSQAPGIGSKTAQRIILELREKLLKRQGLLPELAATDTYDLPSGWQEDIELTLLALGYEAHEIHVAIATYAVELKGEKKLDEGIRLLLERLSQPKTQHP